MLSVKQALDRLAAAVPPLPAEESVPLTGANGRVLAADQFAGLDVPPADNSAMDGYAFRLADWRDGSTALPVSQRIAAGHIPEELVAGSAARIFTGAEMPAGADTVAMQEDCEDSAEGVRILQHLEPGANVRPQAQDVAAGQLLLAQGHRLRAQDLGLLASQGLDSVPVFRRVRVALMSTGDELAEPGQALQPGQIYNSNRYVMTALLQDWGFEVKDFGIVPDQPASVREGFAEAASVADVIVSSGGVSVGEEDHVRAVVEQLGSLDLWRIAIKPGKPFAFGNISGKPFLGLPGNPVSVFVTLLVIARPFLLACQGATAVQVPASRAIARFDQPAGSREEYLRVRSTEQGVELFSNQSSGVLMSVSQSDGLVRQSSGQAICRGDAVDFFPYVSFS